MFFILKMQDSLSVTMFFDILTDKECGFRVRNYGEIHTYGHGIGKNESLYYLFR